MAHGARRLANLDPVTLAPDYGWGDIKTLAFLGATLVVAA
ncbi:hypothetical protein ALMP_14020 [Streptomyces sp. A012304]|nr:hypothetical protein ALMP_14020 [Streptomyces sp. A012304]